MKQLLLYSCHTIPGLNERYVMIVFEPFYMFTRIYFLEVDQVETPFFTFILRKQFRPLRF